MPQQRKRDATCFWTDQEDGVLRELWPYGSKQELLKAIPNRSWKSIMSHASSLGIKRYQSAMGVVWTEAELRQLRELWEGDTPFEQVCAAFPTRTPHAIKSMVTKHGFCRTTIDYSREPWVWTEEKVERLKQLWMTEPVIPKIASRLGVTYWSVLKQACKMGLVNTRLIEAGGLGNIEPLGISPAICAYIAGFVDGEGSIGLYYNQANYSPTIHTYNTDRDVLDWMQSVTNLGNVHAAPTRARKQQSYVWSVVGVFDGGTLLKTIHPYMKIKHEQARLVIHFCENLCVGRGVNVRSAARETAQQIRTLNKRGAV